MSSPKKNYSIRVHRLVVAAILLLQLFFQSCREAGNGKNETDSTAAKKNDFALLNDQIAANPSNPELYFKRASVFLNKSNYKQAYDDISKAVSLDSTKEDYYMLLAEVCFKGLLIQKSLDAFNKTIQLNPKNLSARLKLSELLLYIKAYDKCLAEADEALMIDKNSSKAYFIKGFAFKETGDTAKALSSFQTSVELNPDYYDAYIQLGNIETARRHSIAIQYYNNALRIQPSSTEGLYNRGLVYQHMHQYEKAKEDYERILKIDKCYSSAHFNLGYMEFDFNSNYKAAVLHFTDAINCNPEYVEAFYNRGVAFEQLGNKKAAIRDYKKALEIVPTYKLAVEKLKKFPASDLKAN